MKILLVYPYFLDERIYAEDSRTVPIGVYFVAAVLREQNHDVEILNWHDMRHREEDIVAMLEEKKPDVIGFSIVHANRWGAIDIARLAKKILPGVTIVFGGIGATFLWRHLLKHFPEIDYIVLGEGEHSFPRLVSSLENGDEPSVRDIRGIAYRKGSQLLSTGSPDLLPDLDDLPMPSRYFVYQHVTSSRGCPSACTFCGSPRFWGRRVRFHSPDYFVRQLEQLHQKGVSFFYVSDDTFTMRGDRVIEICRMIIEKGLPITWYAISRVNFVSEEMLYWMRRAGCIQISFGVESGSEKIRKALNKNITTEDIRKAFALTRKYGILPRAYFIYGNPGETPETIRQTIDLMKEIKPLSAIFYILDIFPGTALYDDFLKRTKCGDDIWLEKIEDIMYFETDRRFTPEAILAFGRELRSALHANLPHFAETIELVEREDLRELHADFLSRLAMTFSHGEYASVQAIPDKDRIAELLYKKALSYAPVLRAYLGLGSLLQRLERYQESIAVLTQGMRRYPESDQLALCCGISHICLGQFKTALVCFDAFPESPEMEPYRKECRRAMGLPDT